MADPLSIIGLALTVIQILRPAVQQLKDAYSKGGSVHQSLDELRADSEAVCDLIDNIHRVLKAPNFIAAVQEVQGESQVDLLECLQRALRSCEREAQRLSNLLYDLDISGATGRLRQGMLQLKLDRRSDDLQHIKRNFQDHKSSIQLAFQVVTTCKQMQIAERDALNAAMLKAQISKLEVALEQMAKLLNERLVSPGDKEQTVLLSEMQEFQHSSARVRRQATMRLDQITSILEETQSSRPIINKTPLHVPPRRVGKGRETPPAGGDPSIDQSPASKVLSTPTTPRVEKRVASMPTTPTPPTISQVNALSPETNKLPSPVLPATRCLDTTTTSLHIGAEDFEERLSSLLSTASAQRMGTDKPYNDETILGVGELLAILGKHDWSVRPRLYLVLRMINEVRAMNMLIVEGFKDIHFPFTEVDLTSSLKSAASRQSFLRQQRYVLSSRSVDLVQGGRHHHLDKGADSYFVTKEQLGKGGFSIVHRVQSRIDLMEYALKRIDRRSGTFSKDRKKLLSFENEVHNLKRLSHHHLVKLLGSYTDRRYIGIIMEPVADMDLQQYLTRDVWTTQDYVVLRGFVGCLCSALVYLHHNKCRHKDLKPSNILIKGEQVYIADFGLALDWTEAQRETTMGQPEAYTPAYIAPEVGMLQPRNTASDVWSLGCIYLEIATVLTKKQLRSKAEFFQNKGTLSTNYWQNPEAIQSWIAELSNESTSDQPLLQWIGNMTASNPKLRLTAQDLQTMIAQEQAKGIHYSGPCCANEGVTGDGSDTTSWEGSQSGDETFQTAVLSNGMSDAPTVINDTTTTSIGSDVTLLAPPTSIEETEHTPSHIPKYFGHHSAGGVGQSHPIWLNVGNDTNVPLCATPAAVTEDSYPRPTTPGTEKTKDLDRTRADIPEVQVTKAKHIARDRTGKRTDHEHEATHLRFVHIPKAADPTNEEDSSLTISLAEAFVADDGAFESHMALAREKNPNWRDEITGLIAAEALDKYRANVMLVASNFFDDSLARDVIEHALFVDPQILNRRDVFNHTALHYSANRNRAGMIKYLIRKGANATITNIRGQTALHVAIHRRSLETSKILLRYLGAADINTRDDYGQTALHLACYHDAPTEVILGILAAGADANVKDSAGTTPLDISENIGNLEIADVLREHGADDPKLSPPPPLYQSTTSLARQQEPTHCLCDICCLFQAVRKVGDLVPELAFCTCAYHLVGLSLQTLSDVNAAVSCLNTCTCSSCEGERVLNENREPCVQIPTCDCEDCVAQTSAPGPFTNPPSLPCGDDFAGEPLPPYPDHSYYDYIIDEYTMEDDTGPSPQEITAQALAFLAQAGFKGKKSYRNEPEKALKWVISNNATTPWVYKIVEILLDCGASVNTTDKSGCTGLHIAARTQDVRLAMVLIQRGAQLDVPRQAMFAAKADFTPLRYALWFNNALSLRQLLSAHANINDQSANAQSTLLHDAVTHFDLLGWHIPMLLAHGANTELEDEDGNTPLHLAILLNQRFAVVALLDAGANIEAIGKAGAKPLAMALEGGDYGIIALLLERGANVHSRADGMTCALFYAVQMGYVDIVNILLEDYGAREDIHRTDLTGRSILHVLVHTHVDHMLDLLDKLIEEGANVNAEDYSGSTPLHEAAKLGSSVMVSGLLEYGATINVQNRQGKTPLDLAQAKKHREVVAYLGGTMKKKGWFRRS
ncbi:hypothetical protein AA0113_g7774 [Alternaria arborescens]|uniref:Protein kinase domain-containing protein n=1 Tax=Alternaria arborescens TaxID=156630 RepID=A0A4Q4RN51_9PLEO|nr:hypothetical protein AA0113_g7774 [Alternaria arborescens]